MSYVVLARKYRPRSFEQMVGQPHVVQALGHALAQQRLHHAYLFTGTRGIGKTTISRLLAKSLNCIGPDGQGGITPHPCNVCPACTAIDADRWVDYIELDAASNRSIDEVRDLIERAAYKPAVGRFKVFMIDEAHQLTKDAFNALLKTLEEPPDYLKFVLATTDPEKMLPTVLSRCLQFNLRPMAPDLIAAHLKDVLAQEAVPCEPAALVRLGRAARGSMRDALSLADQAIAYGAGRIDDAVVRDMLGSVDRSQAAVLLDALAVRDGAALLAAVDALRSEGFSAAATLEAMAELLQSAAVEQAVQGSLDDTDPDAPAARSLAGQLGADELQLLYGIAVHGRAELGVFSDEYGALTMVLLRFLAFPPVAQAQLPATRAQPLRAPGPPTRAVASTQQQPRAKAVQATAPTPPEPATPPASYAPAAAPAATVAAATGAAPASQPQADSALGDRWAAAVDALLGAGAVTALTRELAWQSDLVALDDSAQPPIWRLRVQSQTLAAPALAQRLADALIEVLGAPLQLQLEPGAPQDSPARRDELARARRQHDAEQAIERDPLVRSLLAQFEGARIVPGSIQPVEPPKKDIRP